MGKRPIQSSIQTHEAETTDDATRLGNELRQAMSHWPTGVAVLAVHHRGCTEAITINSFISVSLEPALILVSIAETAQIRPLLDDAARFTISILAEDQARIAAMVADRMPGLQRLFVDGDQPMIKDSVAALDCTTSHTHQAGDHILYFGAVYGVRLGRDAEPLLYHHGKYIRRDQ
jgi:flavin reductase (DIM6/NTAB) family NADH-FMN oxidoreductase RutF